MASNNDVVFFIFDSGTGAPLAGVAPTWNSFYDVGAGASAMGSAPAISEMASGMYKFSRPATADKHYTGVIDCTAAAATRYPTFDIRTEETLDAVNLIGTPAGASASADIAAIKSETALIQAKTTNLPASPANETTGTAIKAKTDLIPSDFSDQLSRMLGQLHENSVLDTTTFDTNNNMTSGRLRLYSSKANAEAAGGTGLLATYTITATYSGVQLATYTVVKD